MTNDEADATESGGSVRPPEPYPTEDDDRAALPILGEVTRDNEFEMFRRATLMPNRIDEGVVGSALDVGVSSPE